MKKNIFYFILIILPFNLWSQNYFIPTNFGSLNIAQKGDHAFSISEDFFRPNSDLNFTYSQSPIQNVYANIGGLLNSNATWNANTRIRLERVSIIDFSGGGYYFFSFEKNKKKRKRKKRRKSFLRQAQKMDYGILTSLGLGYSFGKTKEKFDRGSASFLFQKWNAQFRIQMQARSWGLAYFGKIGTLRFRKAKLKGRIEPWAFSAANNFKIKNSYLLWESSIRLYFGNSFGHIYVDRVLLNSSKRFAQDIYMYQFLIGVNVYTSNVFKRK